MGCLWYLRSQSPKFDTIRTGELNVEVHGGVVTACDELGVTEKPKSSKASSMISSMALKPISSRYVIAERNLHGLRLKGRSCSAGVALPRRVLSEKANGEPT